MPTNLDALYIRIDGLIDDVRREGEAQVRAWNVPSDRPEFAASALNLAHYLAVRRRDLRDVQRRLMVLGLSSLGRLEGRVMPTLEAVRASLAALAGRPAMARPSSRTFLAGERRLSGRVCALLGQGGGRAAAALLVTCPSEAAEDPRFMLDLASRGVQAVRINCAHDGPQAWGAMIGHLRAAEAASGRRIRVFMDLAGPKIRTGEARGPHGRKRIGLGESLAIARPGQLADVPTAAAAFAVECALGAALDSAGPGDRVFIDDGRLAAQVEQVEPWGLACRVTRVEERGLRLKPEKGLNFPDADLRIEALTEKDREDLVFVAAHADAIEFSFVQSAADVTALQAALAELRPHDWRDVALVLKIETARAVANLPEIIVQAAGRQPAAIMIARGDLAVEIGFGRTAEMQEEILWLGEASDTPVIWATQVLEHLVKKGTPLRGEMTDAAMSARADCVMLNKGPHLIAAIDQLQALLQRMRANQHRKAPRLRRLRSW